MKPIIEAFCQRAHSLRFLHSPCLYSNPGSRIIDGHGPRAREPICVVDPRIICYEIDDSACFFHFSDSEFIHHKPEFLRSSLLSEKRLRSSDSRDSHGVYDVHLGLHSYLQDGGRSRLEIKVEFHEGPVPLSALLAFYWHRLACSLSSVWCPSYRFSSHFFLGQTGENLTEATCWKVTSASGGSYSRPVPTFEGTHFMTSIYDHWAFCIWEKVQPYHPCSIGTNWHVPVILTLRTWAVWDRNRWLTIILPILYNLCWGSGFVTLIRFINSITCTSDLCFVLDFPGWLISRQLFLRPIQD